MNKVQEALITKYEEARKMLKDKPYGLDDFNMFKAGHESALSEIEKCEPVVELFAQWVIDFIGSNYNSMRTHDEQGKELPLDEITYSLTVHDLLSAFAYTSPQPIEKCEPVAYISNDVKLPLTDDGSYWLYPTEVDYRIPLYTSPISKEWVDLDLTEYEKHGFGMMAKAINDQLKQLNAPKKG